MAIAGVDNRLRNVSFFNLNRCVANVKPFTCDIVHSAEQLSAAEIRFFRYDMTAHCKNAGRKGPDVKVVNGSNAIHISQLFTQTHNIDVSGRSFQQDIDGIPNQDP